MLQPVPQVTEHLPWLQWLPPLTMVVGHFLADLLTGDPFAAGTLLYLVLLTKQCPAPLLHSVCCAQYLQADQLT